MSVRRELEHRRALAASGLDLYGPRRVLPAGTGAIPAGAGSCPGCRLSSHPGWTCGGLTSSEVIDIAWPGARRRLPAAGRRR